MYKTNKLSPASSSSSSSSSSTAASLASTAMLSVIRSRSKLWHPFKNYCLHKYTHTPSLCTLADEFIH